MCICWLRLSSELDLSTAIENESTLSLTCANMTGLMLGNLSGSYVSYRGNFLPLDEELLLLRLAVK